MLKPSSGQVSRRYHRALGYCLGSLLLCVSIRFSAAENLTPLWTHPWRPKLPVIEGATDEGIALTFRHMQPHFVIDRRVSDLLGPALASFVAAHQYGHYVLGHKTSSAYANVPHASDRHALDIEEQQTNCYALRLIRRRDRPAFEELTTIRPNDPVRKRLGHFHIPDFAALLAQCDGHTMQDVTAQTPMSHLNVSPIRSASNDY